MAKLNWGMIGGGKGSNIGDSHRMAAKLDNLYNFCAGALDIDKARGEEFGKELGLTPERTYSDYKTLISSEAERSDGANIVSVVTPNSTHYEITKACLEAGLHVICEKPITNDVDQAYELQSLAAKKNLLLAVMHNYAAYPMVRQARAMVADGALGKIRIVQTEFSHGFLSIPRGNEFGGQAWRQDPKISGKSAVIADVGTHALHLGEFITGQRVKAVSASLDTFVEGRVLEDNAQVMLQFNEGAKGSLWASSVAAGSAHGLRIRVFGEKGSIEWEQENSSVLHHRPLDGPTQQLIAGKDYLDDKVAKLSRVGAGHDSGYIQAFANFYRDVAHLISTNEGKDWNFEDHPIATATDGIQGLAFIDAAIKSNEDGSAWTQL
ncbi:MAG: Gfo/Idh/MocA family protein [Alphaproteobacteria bacterium]